jgi:hypothetical protein
MSREGRIGGPEAAGAIAGETGGRRDLHRPDVGVVSNGTAPKEDANAVCLRSDQSDSS